MRDGRVCPGDDWAIEHIAQNDHSNKNVLQNAELVNSLSRVNSIGIASGLEALSDQYGVLPGISFQMRNASNASSCII